MKIDKNIDKILNKALDGMEVEAQEGALLFSAEGGSLMALLAAADQLRKNAVGDTVTFIKNCNINFTNYCVGSCAFCGFRQNIEKDCGYTLTVEDVAQKASDAARDGAAEVCIQGGLNPKLKPEYYIDICEAIKEKAPDIHIHAFSPMEVAFAAGRAGCTPVEWIKRLKEAGLGSMPGTAAEILDDEIREVICAGKLNVAKWTDIIMAAHEAGVPTTSTIMYGHIENAWHRARHLEIIRDIQKQTGGFTEFIPLSFIHSNTALYKDGLVSAGASGITDLKMHAIARIMLNGYIDNIQVSWLKLGMRMAQVCLSAGVNDLGGTLTEDKISNSAGLPQTEMASTQELTDLINACGRTPAIRSTTYTTVTHLK